MKNNRKLLFISIIIFLILLIGNLALYFITQHYFKFYGNELFGIAVTANIIIFFAYLITILAIHSKAMRKLFQNVTIILVSVVLTLLLVHIAFYLLQKLKAKPAPYTYEYIEPNLFNKDEILGYTSNKNVTSRWWKKLVDPIKHDTTYVFDMTLHTDSIGNRLIDIPGMQNRKKYALFFGCSFTWGLGLQDSQIIPYYFAKYDTGFCVYDFAMTGYGSQNMLAQFQFTNLKQSIKQDSGICFYIYMNGHPQRVIGDMFTYTKFTKDMPYYDYKNDSLHYFGSFRKNRWLISSFYTLLDKMSYTQYFNLNLPKLKPRHFKLTCDIINQTYLEYKKQFKNDNFYVVIYPSNDNISQYLKKYNIKILNFNSLFQLWGDNNKYQISNYDGHPSPLANETITKELIKTINDLKIKY